MNPHFEDSDVVAANDNPSVAADSTADIDGVDLDAADLAAELVSAEELAAADAPPRLERRLVSPRTLLSLFLAFALLAWFLRRLGPETLSASWQLIRSANPMLYLAAIACYYLAFPVRSLRWRLLLANSGEPPERLPPVRDLAEIIYLSWFANSLVPAKLGDLYRGWLLKRTSGVSLSHAMGTIVAERVLDLIVLVSLVIVTGFLTYGDILAQALRGGPLACLESGLHLEALSCTLLQLFTVGMAAASMLIVGLVVFARLGGHAERFLPGRLGRMYARFAGGLVLSFRRFPALLSLSALAWLAEGGSFYLVGQALGFQLPLPLVIFFSLLQAFITAIPLTPGGIGFEIVLAAALQARSYDRAAALALTLTYRTISYLSLVVGGAIVYVLSKKTK